MPSVHWRETVEHIYGTMNEAIATKNMALLDNVMTPGIVDHNPDPGQDPGLAEIKKGFAGLAAAFPDYRFTIEDLLVEGDRVAVRMTARGTHRGEFMGFPATGNAVTLAVFDILRIEDGKIAERWGMPDNLRLLRQVGLVLPVVEGTE